MCVSRFRISVGSVDTAGDGSAPGGIASSSGIGILKDLQQLNAGLLKAFLCLTENLLYSLLPPLHRLIEGWQ
jgi:hypothetical protein